MSQNPAVSKSVSESAYSADLSRSLSAMPTNKLSEELDRKIRELAGTMTDTAVGELLGVSKAAVQERRAAEGKAAFGHAGRYKRSKERQARLLRPGYLSLCVQETWAENHEIQNLLDGWKRCV